MASRPNEEFEGVNHHALLTVWAGLVLATSTFVPGLAAAQEALGPGGISWQTCPCDADLGGMAEISLPEGFLFADKAGTRRFLELTENPASGNELGTVLRQDGEDQWFVVFEFRDIGYVKDDDKNELDAGALLASIKEGTEAGNAERRERGWSTLDIVGWEKSPFYDPSTNNLTWAIRARSGAEESVNYSVRLLGRGGVMSADLVLAPARLPEALPEFNALLGDFSFKTGHRYAEWRQGDKVAAYGLTALVAGGAGAALAKSGLLGKLWKVIVAGVIALAALVKKLFGGGTRESTDQAHA